MRNMWMLHNTGFVALFWPDERGYDAAVQLRKRNPLMKYARITKVLYAEPSKVRARMGEVLPRGALEGNTAVAFKGGTVTQKSGGIGPDDYIFRKEPRGRWIRVFIRVHGNRTEYEADLAALRYIYKNLSARVCTPDAQRIAEKRPDMPRLCAYEFARTFGRIGS